MYVDALGNVVVASEAVSLDGGSQNVTFDTSLLSSGLYFVNLNVDGKVTTQRLSVAH